MGKSLSALIVDSNSNMLSLIAGMLRSIARHGRRLFGEVRRSRSLKSALQVLTAEEGVDVILCDVDVSGPYGGIELLKDCSRDPKRKHLPFIMMTGDGNAEAIPALAAVIREWGAHCLLVKPFAQAVLEDKIEEVLNKLSSPQELIYRKLDNSAPKEALNMIDQLEQEGLHSPKLDNIAGEKHLELGEMERAAERFEKAVSQSEAVYLAALRNQALTQEELGNLDEAVNALEKLDILSPLDLARKLKLGGLLLQTGEQEKGMKLFEQASVLARNLGREPEVKERIEGILEKARYEAPEIKKIKENPHDLKVCNDIALKLRKDGKFNRAEACYNFILEHNPNHPVVLYNKAVLYMVQERNEEAAKMLRAVLAEKPQFAQAKEALDRCQRSFSRSSNK